MDIFAAIWFFFLTAFHMSTIKMEATTLAKVVAPGHKRGVPVSRLSDSAPRRSTSQPLQGGGVWQTN